MKVELIRITNDSVDAIEHAACNCYDSQQTDGKIMKACYDSGHHSVLEFAHLHFHVEGVSRALLAQLTRHRTGHYAVRSQRYVKEDAFNYIIPPSIERNLNAKVMYVVEMKKIQALYDKLVDAGVPVEDARYVLNNACETKFDFDIDLRNFIHLCNERLCTRSQWEIRALVQKMVDIVVEQVPQLKDMLVPKCERYTVPFCPESKSCGRHKKLKEIANEE